MTKKKVLFVCIHNSARSQMAEAFLREMGDDFFEVESAGLEPGSLNPYVIKAMLEIGIDISQYKTKSVFDLQKKKKNYNYIITVCDKKAAEQCPVFPGEKTQKIHWSFTDPSVVKGKETEILKKVGQIRDEIKKQILVFINNNK